MSLREEKFREMKNSFRALNKISQHFYYKKKTAIILKKYLHNYVHVHVYVCNHVLTVESRLN